MPPRKTSTKKIDATTVCAIALKQLKTAADYNRIVAANDGATLNAAWYTLSKDEQTRIHTICSKEPQPDINAIANLITKCDNIIQMQALKAEHGEDTVRAAWKLLSVDERLRLKAICDGQKAEETPAVMTEQPTKPEWNGAYTQDLTEQWSEEQAKTVPADTVNHLVEVVEPKQQKRSLFEVSQDMHVSTDDLEAKLDAIDDPDEQAQLIDLWLQQNAGLQGEMLERVNAYLWVIRKQKHLAEYRATEAKRLRELAEQSENLAKRLEGQLLKFMDAHNIGKLETAHFKVSPRNASIEPLIVDEGYPINQVPDEFVVISKTINRKAAKESIKAGQQLPFAKLGAKSRYLYIR